MQGINLFAGTGKGVFLSTNNGVSWTAVNNGLTHQVINALCFCGTNLFAGSEGVYLSTDYGTSWTSCGLSSNVVYSLLSIDTNIFAGTESGAFLSNINGSNWTAIDSGFVHIFVDVSAFTFNGPNIFAGLQGNGIYLSTNKGTSWSIVNDGLTDKGITSLFANGSNIFAGTWGGVFLSTNNGAEWSNIGLTELTGGVNTLAVCSNYLFAGTTGLGGGVWRLKL